MPMNFDPFSAGQRDMSSLLPCLVLGKKGKEAL